MFDARGLGALDERDDAVRAEAGGIGERRGFATTAAAGERVEVAAGRTLVPRALAVGDELVDAESRRAIAPGVRSLRIANPARRAAQFELRATGRPP